MYQKTCKTRSRMSASALHASILMLEPSVRVPVNMFLEKERCTVLSKSQFAKSNRSYDSVR
jgi:hypothetical protein